MLLLLGSSLAALLLGSSALPLTTSSALPLTTSALPLPNSSFVSMASLQALNLTT